MAKQVREDARAQRRAWALASRVVPLPLAADRPRRVLLAPFETEKTRRLRELIREGKSAAQAIEIITSELQEIPHANQERARCPRPLRQRWRQRDGDRRRDVGVHANRPIPRAAVGRRHRARDAAVAGVARTRSLRPANAIGDLLTPDEAPADAPPSHVEAKRSREAGDHRHKFGPDGKCLTCGKVKSANGRKPATAAG